MKLNEFLVLLFLEIWEGVNMEWKLQSHWLWFMRMGWMMLGWNVLLQMKMSLNSLSLIEMYLLKSHEVELGEAKMFEEE